MLTMQEIRALREYSKKHSARGSQAEISTAELIELCEIIERQQDALKRIATKTEHDLTSEEVKQVREALLKEG